MLSAESFQTYRKLLLSIAYRMLGSMAEAEDIVQETWLRWEAAARSQVESPKAWLSKVVVNLCLDRLKSARARHEDYTGNWLPEPVLTHEPADNESISLAFLVLLESLTPIERAVYLLHEVFEHSHAEIASMLGKEEATCRKVYQRARESVQERKPRFAPSREQHHRLLTAFGTAMSSGDVAALRALLAADATLWADSGGKVAGAARRPLHGAESIALFFSGSAKKVDLTTWSFAIVEINGWPSMVLRQGDAVKAVMTIETDGQAIHAIRNVLNPDKLRLASLD